MKIEQHHDHHHGHDVGERLYLHRHSVIHSLPSHAKIVAALLFINAAALAGTNSEINDLI